MNYLLRKSMENIDSLRHFYDVQKKYIDKKSKEGMKKNRLGMLVDYYFMVLTNGTEDDKKKSTFLNLQKTIENHIEIREQDEKKILYTLKDSSLSELNDVANSANEYRKFAEMPIMHSNNTIIMLITRFEEFIADFLRILYEKFPKKYLDKQTITYSEIAQIGVDDVKQKIIEREIDSIMRQSYSEWFSIFEEHKMNFENCATEYEQLKELYARRNIMVHNCAVVNESYIKNVPNTPYKCGEKLFADDAYINKAFESVKTIIFCIMIEGIRIEKANKDSYVDNLFALAFNELVAKNYVTTKTVFFSLQKSPLIDEKTKHMALVNYWISEIAISGLKCVKTDIEKFDVSALDKTFVVAKLVLLEKYQEATSYIEELYSKDELPFNAIEQWPLFIGYRNSSEYITFKDSHSELRGAIALEKPSDVDINDNDKRTVVKSELEDVQTSET